MLTLALLDRMFHLLDGLYPAGTAPHTNMLLYAAMALAIVATSLQRPLRHTSRAEGLIWAVVVLVCLTGLVLPWPTGAGAGNGVGWNTAASLLLLSAGQLLRRAQPTIGMVCTLLALFAPAVATIGFIHGDREFFGSMAVPTAICLLALAVVNATRFARHKSIRLMLVDNPAGHLVRQQLVIWTLLAVSLPLVTRLMPLLNLSHDSSFPTLYTAQMGLILLGILHFGIRFVALLDNARRLERALVRDVETDSLTGAATRRAARAWFEDRIWRSHVAVIMVDLDHFKNVNDTYGHAVGDAVLQTAARAMQEEMRMTDMVTRWGGEEFAVMFPLNNPMALRARAEVLRVRIAEATRSTEGLPVVTASLGCTIVDKGVGRSLTEAVAVADRAMYRAKEQGRNRVVLCDGLEPQAGPKGHDPRPSDPALGQLRTA
ncbi:GGDEF domain-containing protein [Sagittula sp. MA-2]|jgi:diguanylate cyclase (GGDEF)-like protein|uniref:GGDEF domain-containing protein n=1 Tax=Sagittula sp. MA-2 TaxID=3048007 RepID=UPI0024C3FB17|nr:GGDEF domain-containing protein [Sagittula sp. MA-2]WHZ36309.1 GGDEF domain-containing protein [Sagittula sp. MA-2]